MKISVKKTTGFLKNPAFRFRLCSLFASLFPRKKESFSDSLKGFSIPCMIFTGQYLPRLAQYWNGAP